MQRYIIQNKNSNTSFAYEALRSIILPEGILNVFEVVNVEVEHIRDRKVVLHVRRRRWKDEDDKNVVLPRESLTASGTSYYIKNVFFAHQRLTFS